MADLARYVGVYAWPDQRVEVTAEADHLLIKDADQTLVAQPIDDRTFLIDAADPDNPTVTFANFDEDGRRARSLPHAVGSAPAGGPAPTRARLILVAAETLLKSMTALRAIRMSAAASGRKCGSPNCPSNHLST